MTEPPWRDTEQRSAGLPPAHRARQERPTYAADFYADLYRAPAGDYRAPDGDAASQGRARRPAAHAARPRGYGEADGRGEYRPSRGWGRLPARYGVLIVTAGAAVGAFATMVTGREPGTLLGVVLIVGSLAGVLSVQPKAAYRLVPVPALAGFAAALLAGMVHDRAIDISRTEIALNSLGWMSGGFVWIAAATVVTLVVAVARFAWHARRRRDSDDTFAHVPWDGRAGR